MKLSDFFNPDHPITRIHLDSFLERFGFLLRRSANHPSSTSRNLHVGMLRSLGLNEDGEGAVFVDVGAHLGETSIRLARAFPKAQIHAFEPIPLIYQQLALNAQNYKNIHCHNYAIGDVNERRLIELMSEDINYTMNQVTKVAGDSSSERKVVHIEVKRLDDVCDQLSIKRINYLKTDTEGYELEVLSGATRLLSDRLVDSILAEVTFDKASLQQSQFDDVAAILSSHGYAFSGYYDVGYKASDGLMIYCNAYFLPIKNA